MNIASGSFALSVGNPTFMIDRLGSDCPPLHFLREFTQNSLDAKATDIHWGYNETFVPGVRKLSILDNGAGMTVEDMLEFINKLSSSSHIQSNEGNFGIGAKISALKDNPYGIIYQSWRNGKGAQIWLHKDEAGHYALRMFHQPDGSVKPWLQLEDKDRPLEISESGTRVIFMGHKDKEETFYPENLQGPKTTWIRNYLNRRYFTLPNDTRIHVVEGNVSRKWEINHTVRGQWDFLSANSIQQDTVSLKDFTIYWWLLKDDVKTLQNYSGQFNNRGHVAAILNDELYDVHDSYKARTALQNFGIFIGHERVVIYVQADNPREVVSNTIRDKLVYKQGELPWPQLGEQFQRHMPQCLIDYMESIVSKSEQPDNAEKIRERLEKIKALLLSPAYSFSPEGQEMLDKSKDKSHLKILATRGPDKAKRKSRESNGNRPLNEPLFPFNSNAGKTYEIKQDIDFPRVVWVSVENGMRSKNDDLEGHAGEYINGDQNLLKINGDFPPLLKLIDDFQGQYKNVPGAATIIRDTVRQWHEQSLTETVIRMRQYASMSPWKNESMDDALTPMQLTASTMPIYLLHNELKKVISTRIRSIRPEEQTPSPSAA